MTLSSQSLSDAEFCMRLAMLHSAYQLGRLPVREAAKEHFYRGIAAIVAETKDVPDSQSSAFIDQASSPGFTYPEGDHYILASDYFSWLDGALRLVEEQSAKGLHPLPLIPLEGHHLAADNAYEDSQGGVHVFRVSSDLGNDRVHWPELLAFLASKAWTLKVHTYRLPAARNGRLPSPLCLAYVHPLGTQIRLARLDKEKVAFTTKWKRRGRWEMPEIEWKEWRKGIDLDQCMALICEERTVALPSPEEADEIQKDAALMVRQLTIFEEMTLEERLAGYPRHREACQSCLFERFCHGAGEERNAYVRRGSEEALHAL